MRIPVTRESDNELCGYVIAVADHWRALTVFGGILATCDSRDAAVAHVRARGLPALAAHWQYYDSGAGTWHTCLIQEANATTVTIALGYYSLPGVPTRRLSAADFARGDILTLE